MAIDSSVLRESKAGEAIRNAPTLSQYGWCGIHCHLHNVSEVVAHTASVTTPKSGGYDGFPFGNKARSACCKVRCFHAIFLPVAQHHMQRNGQRAQQRTHGRVPCLTEPLDRQCLRNGSVAQHGDSSSKLEDRD